MQSVTEITKPEITRSERRQVRKTNSKTRSSRKQMISKLSLVAGLVLLQIGILIYIFLRFEKYILYGQSLANILSVFLVLYIVNKPDNPAYKMAWIIVLLSAPIIGAPLYIALAGNKTRVKFIEDARENHERTFLHTPDDTEIQEELNGVCKSASVQSTYISKTAGYPIYKDTSVKYYPLGEENYEDLCKALRSAKHYIFMEYFIIKPGIVWDTIRNILVEKSNEGVDVRLIYDDMGCARSLHSKFSQHMEEIGINAKPFNPVVPVICLRQNNRDHRKITVIDGHTGFTGGINLADEYINAISPYGHWKDTGVRLKGEAVWNLTLMFLQMWNFVSGDEEDYDKYLPSVHMKEKIKSDGYIQPYADTPVDEEIVGENIYMNIINRAKRYVYIATPYLIIDNEMMTALTLAAKNGLDVRIITPGIPDKKMVFMVTQSYYYQLIKAGVKIYKYTPGFIHAKTFICDDNISVVGTVNLDFRSLYLHFECGVWMYNSSVIEDIKADFMETLKVSDEIKLEKIESQSALKTLGQSILRLVAPLL